MSESIFDLINWILKKPSTKPNIQDSVSTYLLNRWLSMVGPDHSNIINETLNRWYYTNSVYTDTESVSNLYRLILPKNTKKINYIKKNKEKFKKINSHECFENVQREISKREVEQQKRMLEEFNSLYK
jgi:hypothetical protein